MAGARGVVEVEVLGVKRRLRLSLQALDRVEVRTGVPFPKLAKSLEQEEEIRFGHLLGLFVEMCRSGGTPLSEEEEEDLLMEDLPELTAAVNACFKAASAGKAGKAGTKKKTSAPSPGGSGSDSPSEN